MPNLTTQLSAEGIILVRQGGAWVAAHLPRVTLELTTIISDPPLSDSPFWIGETPTIKGYEVEATGVADRVWVWHGDVPGQTEITSTLEVEEA